MPYKTIYEASTQRLEILDKDGTNAVNASGDFKSDTKSWWATSDDGGVENPPVKTIDKTAAGSFAGHSDDNVDDDNDDSDDEDEADEEPNAPRPRRR